MRGVNLVIIIGTLGADPEVHKFGNGGSVTNISVATSEQWTDKSTGQKQENTEWHRVALFNKSGEVAQLLKKGMSVCIEGSVRTRKYQDANGQDKYTTEVRADKMLVLSDATDTFTTQPEQETIEVSTKTKKDDFVAPPFASVEPPVKNDFVPPPFTMANDEAKPKANAFIAPPF